MCEDQSQHHSDNLLLALGMMIGGGKKATPCLGVLGLPSLTQIQQGLLSQGLYQHSNDDLQVLEW